MMDDVRSSSDIDCNLCTADDKTTDSSGEEDSDEDETGPNVEVSND